MKREGGTLISTFFTARAEHLTAAAMKYEREAAATVCALACALASFAC
jgi:hypothetical protein